MFRPGNKEYFLLPWQRRCDTYASYYFVIILAEFRNFFFFIDSCIYPCRASTSKVPSNNSSLIMNLLAYDVLSSVFRLSSDRPFIDVQPHLAPFFICACSAMSSGSILVICQLPKLHIHIHGLDLPSKVALLPLILSFYLFPFALLALQKESRPCTTTR